MMDEATSTASSDVLARKKEVLLQRLQKRLPIGQANLGAEVVKLRHDELDEALNHAQFQIESGIVDEHTVEVLENFLSLEDCGWSAKRIQRALKLLRKAGLETGNGPQKQPVFSFSVPKKKAVLMASERPRSQLPVSSERFTFEAIHTFENVVNLSNVKDEIRVVTGKDGSDVRLKEIRNCQFSFTFRPSSVNVQGLYDSKLVFLTIETSLLVCECVRSQIFAIAQQIRIHNSHNLRIHAGVHAAIIIESCTNITMAPYRVVYNNTYLESPPGDAWMRPNDFDWLADGQSPNWMIAPESEWETCTINDK